MNLNTQEFHLCPTTMVPSAAAAAAPRLAPVRLPGGVSLLTSGRNAAGTGIDVAPMSSVAGGTRAQCRNRSSTDATLEPFINSHRQPRILATFPANSRPHLNGEPAPRIVVLRAGDQIQWEEGVAFQVAIYNRPHLGPPPPALVNKPCPVCRVPLAAMSTCILCSCGVALHCEADEESGLQCAQLRRSCPVCTRPLALTEGYASPAPHED
jgi:hypothetical protein